MKTFLVSTLLAVLLVVSASAQSPAGGLPTYAPGTVPALGIALEEYPYPYPVHFLPLSIEGQPLRMAYMDVPPASAGGTVPNGRTVVLLHGKNFPGAYWEGTIRVLTRAGYRVVVPDQIGFLTKSSKPDIPYSFDLLAANTARLLDTLGVQQFALVGHSTGGMLAVRLARTYPDRVTQLVLEDPIGLEDYRQKIPLPPTDRLLADEMAMTTDAYRAYVHHYFVTWKPDYEQFVALRQRMALSGEFPRWVKTSVSITQMIVQQPVRYEYHLLPMPVLLVVGEQDRTAILASYAPPGVLATMGRFPELARDAVRDLPHGQLVVVPSCGHIPHLEQTAAFHAALLKFLATGE